MATKQPASKTALNPGAAWPFPSRNDNTKIDGPPPQDVAIEPQNEIAALERAAKRRKATAEAKRKAAKP